MSDPRDYESQERRRLDRAYKEYADESLDLATSFGQPVSKRLTGPELAAEYWRAYRDDLSVAFYGWDEGQRETDWDMVETLERFAALPHYDEEQP
jgi:hypothetical protein